MTTPARTSPTSSPRETAESSDRLALWITYLNIVLYALCYQLQRPVEPFLVEALSHKAGDDGAASISQTYGELNSFFSAIQTVGSPLVGIMLDRIGIRYASALVFLASAISYAILAKSTNLTLLFISKIPTALQHAFLVAQATAATTTRGDAAARAQALGRMTTAYTIGATIGPALGGYLVDTLGDLYLGAKLAVVGSLLSVFLSLWFLPNVSQPNNGNKNHPVRSQYFLDDLKKSGEMAMRSSLWPLLVVKVLGGVSASMLSTAMPLVLTQNLKFDSSQLGMNMSSSMFAVAAFGAVAMAPLASHVGPPGMARIGLLCRALLETTLASIVSTASGNDFHGVLRVVFVSILYALSSHALATGLTTQTTGVVDKTEQGALLGLEHGLFSLARIGAPPLSTYLLSKGSFWYVAGACSLIDLALVGTLR
jgi:OCT family organic cation transporter-like MFS transporter 18